MGLENNEKPIRAVFNEKSLLPPPPFLGWLCISLLLACDFRYIHFTKEKRQSVRAFQLVEPSAH